MKDAAQAADGLPRGILPLIAFDLRRVSIAEGVRAALATAAVVALNAWLNWPPLTEAALAAMLTCLTDPGGPIRRRLPAVLGFGVLGAAVTVGYGALHATPLAVVVPLAAAGVFCALFARVFGQPAQQVGNLLTVVLVLALTRSITDWRAALALGGAFLGGSLWATLLTLAIWRIHPFLPARRAVAQVYLRLADLARDLCDRLTLASADESVWDAHARATRRPAREAIEAAREAVLATVRARGPVSARAAQTWIRLAAAEQMFGALIGFSDVLASGSAPAERAAARRMLRLLRAVLVVLAHGIETDRIPRLPRLDRAAAAIEAAGDAVPALRGAAAGIAEPLRVAGTLAAPEVWRPGMPARMPLRQAWRDILAQARANLDWRSAALRHALRGAVAAAPAFAVTLHWPTSYGHWLTIMLVLTMQPQVALTYARALERIAGTIAGGVIAAGLAAVCTTPGSIALALFPLAVLAFALRPASFALFMACLTPLIVLLSELGRPGESELTIAAMRALYVLIGSGLAVAAVLLLWPSWEPGQVPRQVAAAIAAHGAYIEATIATLLGEGAAAEAERARRAAGIASNNLEASLHRALLETRGRHDGLSAALTIDAALRRIAGRLSALRLDPGPRRDPEAWRLWRNWVGAVAPRLAAGETALPPRPKLPEGDGLAEALTRIARQMEVIAGAVGRRA
jgi:uncharacterized membrane protein YccC